MPIRYDLVPWNRPSPVKRSNFTSLLLHGKKLNIEVDLGQIESFSCKNPSPTSSLLYSDLQLKPLENDRSFLGSGRSGFYRGHYLKGVGRTCLAVGWNSDNFYHSNGLLLPSGAIREFVISRYLASKGLGHTIVRCKGLLFRKLPRKLKDHHTKIFKSKGRFAPIDQLFQAISYKEDNFARASNIIWYLRSMGGGRRFLDDFNFVDLIYYFTRYLDPDLPLKRVENIGPESFVRLLAKAQKRTFENQLKNIQAGVYWGSVVNNYALDGRFLDLEVPTIFHKNFFGAMSYLNHPKIPASQVFLWIGGLELVDFAFDFRYFNAILINQLQFLIANKFWVTDGEMEFSKILVHLLKKYADGEAGWMKTSWGIEKFLSASVSKALSLEGREKKILQRLIEAKLRQYGPLVSGTPKSMTFDLEKADFNLARPEALDPVFPYVFPNHRSNRDTEADWVNSEILKIEQCRDLDTLMVKLEEFKV